MRRLLRYSAPIGFSVFILIAAFASAHLMSVRAAAPTVNIDYLYASYHFNSLKNPTGLSMAGNLLVITDTGNNAIRAFNVATPSTGLVTLAGNTTAGYVDALVPTQAEFNRPTGNAASLLTIPSPTGTGAPWTALIVRVADTGNSAVRVVCTPLSGGNACGSAGLHGVTTQSGGSQGGRLVAPAGLSAQANLVVDPVNNSIYTLSGSSATPVNSGSTLGYRDGPVSQALFNLPTMAVTSPAGTIVADMGNNMLRVISAQNVTTLAGNVAPGYVDGTASQTRFYKPSSLTYNSADGYYYVADTYNNCIRRVDSHGNTSTYAGMCTHAGLIDSSTLTASKLNKPTGLLISGSLMYVSDSGNNCIRRIDMTNRVISTYIS